MDCAIRHEKSIFRTRLDVRKFIKSYSRTKKRKVYSGENNDRILCKVGRQSRQMCRPDKYGFPRTGSKTSRVIKGFQTGDIVKAFVPKGKNKGSHVGKVAIRSSGTFNVGRLQGIGWKYCKVLHHSDGYSYSTNVRGALWAQ